MFKIAKRVFDIIFSLSIIFITIPALIIASALIKVSSTGPVLFIQERVGENGRLFKIYKLRTMSVNINRDTTQTKLKDPGVFFIGGILRRTKIDELPQIVNVLLGDMSIVGPRPCLQETKDEMPEWALQRFAVRPGLTGISQTQGNIALSWEERWKLDVEYVNNHSIALDCKIIFKTVLVILLGEERFQKSA